MSMQGPKNLIGIQDSVDQLIQAEADERQRAFQRLAKSILEHFDHATDVSATSALFSPELPNNAQRFAAVWLVRVLTRSAVALDFGDTQRLTASLCDRVFQNDVYKDLNIEKGAQTYEKLQALTAHAESVIEQAVALIDVAPDVNRMTGLHKRFQELLNGKRTRPLLIPFFPRHLTDRVRVSNLFGAINDYADASDGDPIISRDAAWAACDEFESAARDYGTKDSDRILGGMARRLKSAVASHFESLEANDPPRLDFSPITKKYPLQQRGATVRLKVRITNTGTGRARDLRLDEVDSDSCLQITTPPTALGTLQPGDSFVLDIDATVLEPSPEVELVVALSQARLGDRVVELHDFTVEAQRVDVEWERVELEEPYPLEPVTTEYDLIGRRDELKRLLRLANLTAVGSGIIYGQKRVGKTSLANAVAESLEDSSGTNWVVINKGSGDYVGGNAHTTLRTLGDVLVQAMKDRIPGLSNLSSPDFSDGLAPLTAVVDNALAGNDLRLLFILDEFDELPHELLARTNLATSLFQPPTTDQ